MRLSLFHLSVCVALFVIPVACVSSSRAPSSEAGTVFERSFTTQEVEMLAAVLSEIGRQQLPAAVGCLSLLGPSPGRLAPSDAFLSRVSPQRRMVRSRECPPTYTKMTQMVDSLGRSMEPPRPPGYVDPYYIELGRPQFDGADHAYVYVRDSQGTSGREFSCVVGGAQGRVVSCKVVKQWVS